MPHRQGVKLLQQRLKIIKLSVQIMKTCSVECLGEEQFGSCAPEVLLCMAVAVGQLEGKPMSALKLSQYVGMPRATVVRKLAALVKRGLVERDGHSSYVLPLERLNSPETLRTIATLARSVHDASTELLKLDR